MRYHARIHGFTLIEVIIALSLLSIMMLMLFAGLRISAKSWDKGDTKLSQINDMSAMHNFLHNQVSAALPLWDDFSEEEKKFSFQGAEKTLQFVATLPASSKRLGLQIFNLRLDNHKLWVNIKPFYPSLEHNQWKKEEVILIDSIMDIELAYFGKQEDDSSKWQADWSLPYLPQLIEIKIKKLNEMQWPKIILRLNNYENLPKNTNLFEKELKKLKTKKKEIDLDPSNPF